MALTRTLTLSLAAAGATKVSAVQTLVAAGNLLINGTAATGGVATLDVARRILITSTGDDSAVNWTITGTGANGLSFSEVVAGSNAGTSQSLHDFLTVTSVSGSAAAAANVSVGTSSVGSTQPWVVDGWANPAEFGYGVTVTGSATYNIEGAWDDLSPQWDVNSNAPNWQTVVDGSAGVGASGAIANQPVTMLRLTITSGTGTVTAKILQAFKAGKV